MEAKPMIELEGLKKYFSISKGLLKQDVKHVKAVDDISLTINQGEIVGLVGESGSGKTTLARVILNLTNKTEGKISINGIDLSKASRAEIKQLRSDVAVVFQDPASNLNPRQTVESSIMRPMIIHGVPKEEAKKKEEAFKPVQEKIKMALADRIKDVVLSKRLSDSPACVVIDENDPSIQMERMMRAMGQGGEGMVKPILEVNADHPMVKKLEGDASEELVKNISEVLLDQSLLVSGKEISDPAEFVKAMNSLIG